MAFEYQAPSFKWDQTIKHLGAAFFWGGVCCFTYNHHLGFSALIRQSNTRSFVSCAMLHSSHGFRTTKFNGNSQC